MYGRVGFRHLNMWKAVCARGVGSTVGGALRWQSTGGGILEDLSPVAAGLKGKHLDTLFNFSKEEVQFLLDVSKSFQDDAKSASGLPPLLKGKTMAMLFQKRSTRTRVSTETGLAKLGGHALFLSSDDIQLGVNESVRDTVEVLSRFNDVILARVYSHDVIEEMMKYSSVPIINGLSDLYHPLQVRRRTRFDQCQVDTIPHLLLSTGSCRFEDNS